MPQGKLRLISQNDADQRLAHAVALAQKGLRQDALSIFKSLVDEGKSVANCYLGMLYEYGNADVKENHEYAKFYYEKAAQDGWVPGYIGLGRVYYYGLGVEQDLEKAYQQFMRIHDAAVVSPIADFYLGQMHQLGEFVSKDLDKAIFFFQRSADHGYLWSKSRLAEILWKQRKYYQWFKMRVSIFMSAFATMTTNEDGAWRTQYPTSTMGPSSSTNA